MRIHQPEHFPNGGLSVCQDRFFQKVANQRIERGLMALRIGAAGIERLFINSESDIFHK